jgi:hypothetical protein
MLAKGFVVDSTATNVKAGRAAILGSGNQTVTIAGAAADVLGIFINEFTGMDAVKIATGKATVSVALHGIVRCEAGAAVARRDRLTTDSVGRVITKTQTAGGTAPAAVLGIALTPASAAGDMIDVLLTPGGRF